MIVSAHHKLIVVIVATPTTVDIRQINKKTAEPQPGDDPRHGTLVIDARVLSMMADSHVSIHTDTRDTHHRADAAIDAHCGYNLTQ